MGRGRGGRRAATQENKVPYMLRQVLRYFGVVVVVVVDHEQALWGGGIRRSYGKHTSPNLLTWENSDLNIDTKSET